VAEELGGAERERGIALYSLRSQAHGAGEWRVADVITPAQHRLYRARASEHFVLEANDRRISVDLGPTRRTQPIAVGLGRVRARSVDAEAPADGEDAAFGRPLAGEASRSTFLARFA
jgi:hypothetical protein